MIRLCALSLFAGAFLSLSGCGPSEREPTALEELVEAYESGALSREEYLEELASIEDDGTAPTRLTGRLSSSLLLHARAEAYVLEDGFTVAPSAMLVVAPGARLELANDATVEVEGRLYAVASPDQPIAITATSGGHYTDLYLRNAPNQVVGASFSRGARLVHVTHDNGERTLLESSTFDQWIDLAIAQNSSVGLHVRDSDFGYDTPEDEVSGESIRTRDSGGTRIEGSRFSYRTGYRDVLDLQDCRPELEDWPIVLGNTFDGGEDDGIDLDNCSAWVVGNYLRNFRPIDLTSQDAGVNGGGITGDGEGSAPILVNNIIEGCFHAIGFKNGARPAIIHNTLVDNNIGITLYQSAVGNASPAGLALNNVLVGNTGWLDDANNDVVLNGKWWRSYNQVDDVQGSLEARFNTFATASESIPGEGNLSADPLLDTSSGLPELSLESPARAAGTGEISVPGVPEDTLAPYLERDFAGRARDLGSAPDQGALVGP